MRRVLRTIGFIACFVLFQVGLAWSATVVVDVAVDEGPMTHRANGYLVSIEPGTPAMELIRPLKPTSFRGNAGYVLKNYDRLTEAGVTEFQLTLGLVFEHRALQIFDLNRIGLDGDYAPWLAHVDRIIDQVVERKRSVLWDLYNEPDLAAVPLNVNDRLKEGWRLAYQRIKQRVPGAQIVGPSVSRYPVLEPFLDWAWAQQVLPDVVAYHEYDDPADAPALVERLRTYLRAHDLDRPISVNEILGQESWTKAGYTAGVLAAYERARVRSAMRACWPDPQDTSRDHVENTCDNPTLDGLLYVDREMKRPSWHIYRMYAEMQGTRVATMTDSPKLHALAAADAESGSVKVLLGKYDEFSSEETRVVVRHLDKLRSHMPGAPVRLCAVRIPDVGSGPLESPILEVDGRVAFGSEVILTLPRFGHSDAYGVEIGSSGECGAFQR